MKKSKKPAAEKLLPVAEAALLLNELGLIIKNSVESHWFSLLDRHSSILSCFHLLRDALERVERIKLRVVGNVFEINGYEHKKKSVLTRYFVSRLTDFGVTNLQFAKDVDQREFRVLIDNLCSLPGRSDDGSVLAGALADADVHNIILKRVVYREISDDQIVFDIGELNSSSLNLKADKIGDKIRDLLRSGSGDHVSGDVIYDLADQDVDSLARCIMDVVDKDDPGSRTDQIIYGANRVYRGLRGTH